MFESQARGVHAGGAVEALALIRSSEAKLAAATETPVSRHLAFAGLMGVYVASPALPVPWRLGVLAIVIVATIAIVRWDRRRMGVFVNGYRRGRTRIVTVAMLAILLPMYGAGVWATAVAGMTWLPIVLGVLATAIAYIGSLCWCRVFRRELLGVS